MKKLRFQRNPYIFKQSILRFDTFFSKTVYNERVMFAENSYIL